MENSSHISEDPPMGGDNLSTIAFDLNSPKPPSTTPSCDDKGGATFDLEQYYYKLSEDIFIFFDPIVTLVGVVGALLIIVVMQRPALRVSSVSIYMTALSVSDILVLVLDFINNWFKMELKIYLLGTSDGFCKFHRFFFNVVYTYSAWLVVSLAMEKMLVVWFPFKAKTLCNRRNATIVVSLLPVPIVALYLYNLWAWELSPEGQCDMVPDWVHFQSYIAPWLSGTVYSYVPIVLLIGLNGALVYKLWEARRKRHSNLGLDKGGTAEDKVEWKVTVTVVSICIAFVLLTTPLTLFYIILFGAGEFLNPGPQLALAEVLILILGLSNHAINFFLYILTSGRFRSELRAMFGCQASGSSKSEQPKMVNNPKIQQTQSGTPSSATRSIHVTASTDTSTNMTRESTVSDTSTIAPNKEEV